MKRQNENYSTTHLSKKPFQYARLDPRKFSEDSESSDALDLSFSFQSDFPHSLDSLSISESYPVTVTKFVDICAAKPNLTIYGRNFTIPCHDFPLCSKSKSLARLIQQPGNDKDQTFRFDDKVSCEVASEFLTRCYDWEPEWRIVDPYDYMQLYFLIDMHFSDQDKEQFLADLASHIKFMLEGLRIEQKQHQSDKEYVKQLDEQGCNLFFLSYELKLELMPKTWMLFLTHFRNGKARPKLQIDHLNFLSTKRRPQDYHINNRFFKFLLNLCIHGHFKWEDFNYEWARVQSPELESVSRWLNRQSPRHKTMVLDIYGHVMHSIISSGIE